MSTTATPEPDRTSQPDTAQPDVAQPAEPNENTQPTVETNDDDETAGTNEPSGT